MRLLIYTFAINKYLEYAELFKYVLHRSYPEYDLQVNITAKTSPKHYGACVRYLWEPPVEYDYYYITDVDMMILPEIPALAEYHLAEMQETGLCYSNTPRGGEVQGPNRLTGLHFCNAEWFERTRKIRQMYHDRLNVGDIGELAIDDELMLMKIVYESKLKPPPGRRDLIGRHHGIHLGTLRGYRHATLQTRRYHIYTRVTPEKARQWQEIIAEPEYRAIVRRIQSKDILWELQELDKFTKQLAKR